MNVCLTLRRPGFESHRWTWLSKVLDKWCGFIDTPRAVPPGQWATSTSKNMVHGSGYIFPYVTTMLLLHVLTDMSTDPIHIVDTKGRHSILYTVHFNQNSNRYPLHVWISLKQFGQFLDFLELNYNIFSNIPIWKSEKCHHRLIFDRPLAEGIPLNPYQDCQVPCRCWR